jgi:hypothetical protein
MRTTATGPGKFTQTTANTTLPKLISPPTQVELPITPAVPAKGGADTISPAAKPDPQADLKTAIPDVVNLLRLGDIYTFKKNYTPPNQMEPQQFQNMLETVVQAMGRMAQNPKLRETMMAAYAETAKNYESFENEKPTYNTTGDEASYIFSRQPLYEGDETQVTTTFVKINGKWYMKQLGN